MCIDVLMLIVIAQIILHYIQSQVSHKMPSKPNPYLPPRQNRLQSARTRSDGKSLALFRAFFYLRKRLACRLGWRIRSRNANRLWSTACRSQRHHFHAERVSRDGRRDRSAERYEHHLRNVARRRTACRQNRQRCWNDNTALHRLLAKDRKRKNKSIILSTLCENMEREHVYNMESTVLETKDNRLTGIVHFSIFRIITIFFEQENSKLTTNQSNT